MNPNFNEDLVSIFSLSLSEYNSKLLPHLSLSLAHVKNQSLHPGSVSLYPIHAKLMNLNESDVPFTLQNSYFDLDNIKANSIPIRAHNGQHASPSMELYVQLDINGPDEIGLLFTSAYLVPDNYVLSLSSDQLGPSLHRKIHTRLTQVVQLATRLEPENTSSHIGARQGFTIHIPGLEGSTLYLNTMAFDLSHLVDDQHLLTALANALEELALL